MPSQYFFYRQKIIRINFGFCKRVRKNICAPTFKTYKISNFDVNSIIFFRANLCQISSSIINIHKSIYFIESNTQRFESITVLYEMS